MQQDNITQQQDAGAAELGRANETDKQAEKARAERAEAVQLLTETYAELQELKGTHVQKVQSLAAAAEAAEVGQAQAQAGRAAVEAQLAAHQERAQDSLGALQLLHAAKTEEAEALRLEVENQRAKARALKAACKGYMAELDQAAKQLQQAQSAQEDTSAELQGVQSELQQALALADALRDAGRRTRARNKEALGQLHFECVSLRLETHNHRREAKAFVLALTQRMYRESQVFCLKLLAPISRLLQMDPPQVEVVLRLVSVMGDLCRAEGNATIAKRAAPAIDAAALPPPMVPAPAPVPGNPFRKPPSVAPVALAHHTAPAPDPVPEEAPSHRGFGLGGMGFKW